MVLTRAALEKFNKEELKLLFVENDNKLNSNIANLTDQLAEVNKTSERGWNLSYRFLEQEITASKNALLAWKNNVAEMSNIPGGNV